MHQIFKISGKCSSSTVETYVFIIFWTDKNNKNLIFSIFLGGNFNFLLQFQNIESGFEELFGGIIYTV